VEINKAPPVTRIVAAMKGRKPNCGPPSARGFHVGEKISPMDTPSFTKSWMPCQAMKIISSATMATIEAAARKTTRLGMSSLSRSPGAARKPVSLVAVVT
jgi:hypothetical protein